MQLWNIRILLLCLLLPGPLLVWDSSVIGGSASSWIVGTDASRPEDTHKHTGLLTATNYLTTYLDLYLLMMKKRQTKD